MLPSVVSLIRLVGAVPSEKDEDWSERRCSKDDSILKAFEKRLSEPEPVSREDIIRKAPTMIEMAKDEDIAIEKRAA